MRLIPALLACARAVPALAAPADMATVLAGPQRSAANKARDVYRHPADTLAFFGLKPTMTVVEVSPGAGWYTEVLAPYLRDGGKLYVAAADPDAGDGAAKAAAKFKARLAVFPAAFDKVTVTPASETSFDRIAPAGSADMVVTFRNVHNWSIGGYAPRAFAGFFAALKHGGVLGIEEHRLPEDKPDAMQKTSGYMKVSTVKALAAAAGFRFVAASDINANAKDSHDYPKGVWTLPPTFDEGDKDHAKYAAIGESDRMTLKFVKP
jgi:predicted methyltransferase